MNRLTAISGFDGKGPASFLLEIKGRRLLLDLGEGPDAGRRPDLARVGPVDAVLISHGHADHAGALDLLGSLGDPQLYATALARRSGGPLLEPAVPIGEASAGLGLAVETGSAGHAAGAVWMRIGGAEGLLYTGDISGPDGLFAWEPPPAARALLFDASYGDVDEGQAVQLRRLLDLAARGPLLLPAPANGRGLEMALACFEAGHPIALCPAHSETARLLLDAPDALSPSAPALLERMVAAAAELGPSSPARGVMVAAGANCGSGLAAVLGPRFVADAGATVLFTGHLSQGAPSARWVAAGAARWMRWNVHPCAAVLDALFAGTRPAIAMAAFVAAPGRAEIARRFSEVAFADRAVMEW